MIARIFWHLIGIFCTQRSILDSIECYCTQLHSIKIFCTQLHSITLFEPYCTQLLQYFALKCTQINSTVNTPLHSPALHCAQLHCALHSTSTCNCTQMHSDELHYYSFLNIKMSLHFPKSNFVNFRLKNIKTCFARVKQIRSFCCMHAFKISNLSRQIPFNKGEARLLPQNAQRKLHSSTKKYEKHLAIIF